jgi:hypothetical protein
MPNTKLTKEQLIKRIKNLEKENELYRQVDIIQKEILKEHGIKNTTKKTKEKIKKLSGKFSLNKILAAIGLPKSSYYYRNKNKQISEYEKQIIYEVNMI